MPDPTPIRWEQDDDRVVTLLLDAPGRRATTVDAAFTDALEAAVDRLEAERDAGPGIRGVILTSAKESFCAGADLRELLDAGPDTAAEVYGRSLRVKRLLRRLETLGRPVVAALNGSALGGGYEIALACHHRIALDAAGSTIGLPEVTFGLLPGGGGLVRAVRLLGVADALTGLLLSGTAYPPRAALDAGLVHEVAADPAEMLRAARRFIDVHPDARQPWDAGDYRMPGGSPSDPELAARLPLLSAMIAGQPGADRFPAPRAMLAAAVEGAQVDFAGAELIEARYFTEVACGQVAGNMVRGYFDLRAVRSAGRPDDGRRSAAAKVAVLGAGMMGAGIGYACALAGVEVVLKDVSAAAAERGRQYAARLLEREVAGGRRDRAAADAVLARITPTADPADLAGCDTVIEAVFEDPALKQKVFQEVQDIVAPDALLASNTSTLPITLLADAVRRPEDFVGLHFFSPVERMPLVEVVRGRRSGEEALARAVDLVRQLGKTPVVVNDSRGFFTSRVICAFLNEGIAMVGEGVEPASVEQAAAQAGYPARVLALADELSLALLRRIRDENRRAAQADGGYLPDPAEPVIDRMTEEFGRPGRSGGAGFYDYPDGRRGPLWPGLREHFTRAGEAVPFDDLVDRLLFREVIEAVRCLDEQVVTRAADANVASLLGIGFPGWTGGVIQFVRGYPGGVAGFTDRARHLQAAYGDRFAPPASLAERGEIVEG